MNGDKGSEYGVAAAWSAVGSAIPAAAATQNASVTANVVKPLTLTALQNMDLGTLTLAGDLVQRDGRDLSRRRAQLRQHQFVCTGATAVARFNVTGTNKQVVLITAPNVTLTDQADSTKTLTLVVDNPGSVTLTSSGAWHQL